MMYVTFRISNIRKFWFETGMFCLGYSPSQSTNFKQLLNAIVFLSVKIFLKPENFKSLLAQFSKNNYLFQ